MKNIILISLWFTPIIVYSQPTSCGGLVNTGNNHTILLSNLSPGLDGNPFPTGAYIIVMFENENGQLTCGGFTEWTGVNTAIAAFGDDALTPEKDGFEAGEEFVFRVELPNGELIEQDCIELDYATGGIFSHTNSFAVNGISGLTVFEAFLEDCVDCPQLGLDIGDFCDDQNPMTAVDTVNQQCECEGIESTFRFVPYVVASAGAFYENGAFSLSWTSGEVMIEAYREGMYWLKQGFQQAEECFSVIIEVEEKAVHLQVYPNPFSHTVYIEFEENFPHTWILSNSVGQVLIQEASFDKMDILDLSSLPAGIYFLTLSSRTGAIQEIFTLTKQ